MNQESWFKKIILAAGLLLLFAIIHTSYFVIPTYAHLLKTDGSIGAVLHIDPDDDPVAGQQAGFFFEFKDKQNKFTPRNCDCTFSITEDGKEIFSQALFANNANPSLDNASLFFTFPERNVYQVKVSGKPNSPNAFQAFTLVYDIRVAKGTNQSSSPIQSAGSNNWLSIHFAHLIAAIIIAVFFVFSMIWQKLKPKRR